MPAGFLESGNALLRTLASVRRRLPLGPGGYYGINMPAAKPHVEPDVPQELIDKFTPKRLITVKLRNPAGHPGQERICYSTKKRIIVRAGRRGGKSQPLDAKIYTPCGPVRMGDVRIGQTILTPFGDTATIEGIYPQGTVDIFRVIFGDGT